MLLAANGPAFAASWAYQLQNADPAAMSSAAFDIYVLDYSSDGTDAGAYSANQVSQMAGAGKTALCYLSIGEAEDYRFYWQEEWATSHPAWLGPENPDWQGNYKVLYWQEDWWATALQPYLDRILAAGFHGVYMDIIDAYYYWPKNGYDIAFTSQKMIDLVQRIASYCQAKNPDFLIYPQNGLTLYDDAEDEDKTRYLAAIDGVGVEDVFFNAEDGDMTYRQSLLSNFLNAGKTILSVEYIAESRYPTYRNLAAAYPGLIPYAAAPDRELDELNLAWLPKEKHSSAAAGWRLLLWELH